jgi:hypothetical protein
MGILQFHHRKLLELSMLRIFNLLVGFLDFLGTAKFH